MKLNQLQALAAALLATSNETLAAAVAAGRDGEVADILNTDSDLVVWRLTTQVDKIFGAIRWDAFTVDEVPDGTLSYTNRALACQSRQLNLQILLQGRESVDSASPVIQAALHDALAAVPSGPLGVTVPAGWASVKEAMTRNATLAEAMLATGTGTSDIPASMTWEGLVNSATIATALRGTPNNV